MNTHISTVLRKMIKQMWKWDKMLIGGGSGWRGCENSLCYSVNIFVSLKWCQSKKFEEQRHCHEVGNHVSGKLYGTWAVAGEFFPGSACCSVKGTCTKAICPFKPSFQTEVKKRQILPNAAFYHIRVHVSGNDSCSLWAWCTSSGSGNPSAGGVLRITQLLSILSRSLFPT